MQCYWNVSQIIEYLQHVCTVILFLAELPGCSLVSPQEEPPVGKHPLHLLILQRVSKTLILPEMSQMSSTMSRIWDDVVQTCHASNDTRCFNDVSSLHFLCCNDPSFAVASCYQSDISRPLHKNRKVSIIHLFFFKQKFSVRKWSHLHGS